MRSKLVDLIVPLLLVCYSSVSSAGCRTLLVRQALATDFGRFYLGFNPDSVIIYDGKLYQFRDGVHTSGGPILRLRQIRVRLGEDENQELEIDQVLGLATVNEYHSYLLVKGKNSKLYFVDQNSQVYDTGNGLFEAPSHYGPKDNYSLPMEFRPFRRAYPLALSGLEEGEHVVSGGIVLPNLERSTTSGVSPAPLSVQSSPQTLAHVYLVTDRDRVYSNHLIRHEGSVFTTLPKWSRLPSAPVTTQADFVAENIFAGLGTKNSQTVPYVYQEGKVIFGPSIPNDYTPIAITALGSGNNEHSYNASSIQSVLVAMERNGRSEIRFWNVPARGTSTWESSNVIEISPNERIVDLSASQVVQDSERHGFYPPYWSIGGTFFGNHYISRRILVLTEHRDTGKLTLKGVSREGLLTLPWHPEDTQLPDPNFSDVSSDPDISPPNGTSPTIQEGD